jgi:hypothetical protein
VEGSCHGIIEAWFRYLPEGTEENNEDTLRMFLPTFKPSNCRIQIELRILGLHSTGFPPQRPGFDPRSCNAVLWWTEWHWGMFSTSSSVSPSNSRSTNCSTFIYHAATQGRRGYWRHRDRLISCWRYRKVIEHTVNCNRISRRLKVQGVNFQSWL